MKELEDILDLNVFFCHETSLLWNWLNNQLQLLSGKKKMSNETKFYNNGVICASWEMGGFLLQGRNGPPF
jgi:hypothetical protein